MSYPIAVQFAFLCGPHNSRMKRALCAPIVEMKSTSKALIRMSVCNAYMYIVSGVALWYMYVMMYMYIYIYIYI